MPGSIKNISLSVYKKFLKHSGCKCLRTRGGHKIWSRSDLARCMSLQSHIDPVPEFIIKQHLRHLGISKTEFIEIINAM